MPSPASTRTALLIATALLGGAGDSRAAEITVNDDNTRLVLSGTNQTDAVLSAGAGNTVELQAGGTLAGNLLAADAPGAAGFDSLAMAGSHWKISGTAALAGVTATTLRVASGTLEVAGGIDAGAGAGATIDAGAALLFTGAGTLAVATIINNGTLTLSRAGTSYYTQNITGAGIVVSTAVSWLTGSNTHTGGVRVQGSQLHVADPSALGTGTVTIASGDLYINRLADALPGDFTFVNPLAGAGRVITRLASGTDSFRFAASAAGAGFNGTFI
ncbi:MAG: hypothetical protein LBC18_11150, partial [Opitutaceae bacterium]|nr:hypothetical protein [Opitutaceae bacterium]